jgi:putative ABC transport system permease protein
MLVLNTCTDIRISLRALRKNAGFALTAIGTLALGIGANTAIFSVLNATFLRPLPYSQPEQLVWVTEYFPKFNRDQVFIPEYAAWRQQNSVFNDLEAYGISIGMNVTSGDRPAERIQVGHVTPGFFAMLGIQPKRGRFFSSEEDQPGKNRVAILSDAFWRKYFVASTSALEGRISLNGDSYAIIGVMPPGFVDLSSPETGVWLPDAVDAKRSIPSRNMGLVGGVIGRLAVGKTAEGARANLEIITRGMDRVYLTPWSLTHATASARVLPLRQHLVADKRDAIYILMGAVGFILLIVCSNMANLSLSRALARDREIGLRAALGATRFHLVRLLLIESVLLGLCGGILGLALVYFVIPSLRFLLPATALGQIPIDWHVLGFSALCSIATAILFGLTPAITASKADLNTCLKLSAASSTGPGRNLWLRQAFTVAEIALSTVLLTAAGLLLRSFLLLINVYPGFSPHNVLAADVSLAPPDLYGPAQQTEFFGRTLDAIRGIPGVQYAAVTDQSPLKTFQSLVRGLAAEGEARTDAIVIPNSVSADYFRALQIPIRRGRDFDSSDRDGSAKVVIINQALARILFQDMDPVGLRIRYGNRTDPWVTVVGVVGDIRHRGLDDKVWPELYQPFDQAPSAWMSLIIKTATDPSLLVPAVRKAVIRIDPNQPLFDIQSLEERVSDSVAQRRQRAMLLASLASLALVIAMVGVYGVVEYSVVGRTREVGVRIALGARPQFIVNMVLGQGLRMALLGTGLGLALAMGLKRALSSFVFGVTTSDAATFVSVCFLLVFATCIATYIPARRAADLDPMDALRSE